MAWGRKGSKSIDRKGGLRKNERLGLCRIEGEKRKREERKRREKRREMRRSSSVVGFFFIVLFLGTKGGWKRNGERKWMEVRY